MSLLDYSKQHLLLLFLVFTSVFLGVVAQVNEGCRLCLAAREAYATDNPKVDYHQCMGLCQDDQLIEIGEFKLLDTSGKLPSKQQNRQLKPTKETDSPSPTVPSECEDEKKKNETFKRKEDGQKKTCKFYSSNNSCNKKIMFGVDEDKSIWEVCKMSCNMCGTSDSPPPTVPSECEDEKKKNEAFKRKEDGQKKTCKFYSSNSKCDEKITFGIDEDKSIWEVCKKSCNMCGTSVGITEQNQETDSPTKAPTKAPTKMPTKTPTKKPNKRPNMMKPNMKPNKETNPPTKKPNKRPNMMKPNMKPNKETNPPTKKPNKRPNMKPNKKPNKRPNIPNKQPETKSPTKEPTKPPELSAECKVMVGCLPCIERGCYFAMGDAQKACQDCKFQQNVCGRMTGAVCEDWIGKKGEPYRTECETMIRETCDFYE